MIYLVLFGLLSFCLCSDISCSTKHVDMVCGSEEGCVNNTCQACFVDEECGKEYFCSDDNKCLHSRLFPLSSNSVWAIVFTFFLSVLGGATGVGGGSLLVPVYGILSHFKSVTAAGLSQGAIVGNGLSAFIVALRMKHPLRNRPRIYFDTLFVFVPSIMVGCFIGVMLGPLLPNYVIMVLLTLVLIWLLIRNCGRTVAQYKKDKENRKQSKINSKGDPEREVNDGGFTGDVGDGSVDDGDAEEKDKEEEVQEESLVRQGRGTYISGKGGKEIEKGSVNPNGNADSLLSASLSPSPSSSVSSELQILYQKESRVSLSKCIFIVCVLALVVFVSLSRPSRHTASVFKIPRCGAMDWVIFGLYILVSVGLTAFGARYLYVEESQKKKLDYEFCEGDIHWSLKTSVLYPFYSFAAGVLASTLGIGGAIITQPMLDSMGVLPVVITATTPALLLVSSLSSFIQYSVAKLVPIDFVVAFFLMSIVGAFIGSFVVGKIVMRYQMSWLLFLLMTVLYLLSVSMTAYYSVFSVVLLWGSSGLYSFTSPCS